ncbi:hypothetical protein ACH5RR_032449, partial [Cinchona calisaya]
NFSLPSILVELFCVVMVPDVSTILGDLVTPPSSLSFSSSSILGEIFFVVMVLDVVVIFDVTVVLEKFIMPPSL